MTDARIQIHERIHFILLGFLALSLTVSVRLTSVIIMLSLLNWLIEGGLVQKIKGTFVDRISLLWILLFVVHILGILLSENRAEAFSIVERRLSLLIFPLLLWKPVTGEMVRKIALVFVFGIIAALIVCNLKAGYLFLETRDSTVFYYHQFSRQIGIHAVYLAAYAVFSIHILLRFTPWEKPFLRSLSILVIAFLVFSCFLLSSKMMLFVLFFGVFVAVFQTELMTQKMKVVWVLGLIIVFVAGIFLLPNVKKRFDFELGTNFKELKTDELPIDATLTGTSFRLLVWKHSLDIINEQKMWLTGVGIGDYQDLLNQKYLKTGMYMGNPALNDVGYRNYNPHNQYIEILLSVGIIGLLAFLILLFMLFNKAKTKKNKLLLQLIFIFVFFSMSESVLATNKGIVFFLFFFCLLNRETNDPKLTI